MRPIFGKEIKVGSLCDIPSGMGGTLPARVLEVDGDNVKVQVVHTEYASGREVIVPRGQVKRCSYVVVERHLRLVKGGRES